MLRKFTFFNKLAKEANLAFSVMAAKLYEQKYLTLGTLVAIFLSTSDEAFIILLSSGTGAVWVLPTLAAKITLGIVIGYVVDFGLRVLGKKQTCAEMPQTENGAPTTVKDIFIQNYSFFK